MFLISRVYCREVTFNTLQLPAFHKSKQTIFEAVLCQICVRNAASYAISDILEKRIYCLDEKIAFSRSIEYMYVYAIYLIRVR